MSLTSTTQGQFKSHSRLFRELLFFVNVFAGTIAFTIVSFTVLALLISPFL